jgi:hypothetical protein
VVRGDPATLALLRDRIVRGRDASCAAPTGCRSPGRPKDRWGVELFAAQIDAMTRNARFGPSRPGRAVGAAQRAGVLGAWVGHRLRERPRVLRIAALTGIALIWVAASIVWYRFERQLIGVPYGIVALALGAWLANRNWRRTPA